MQLSCYCVAQYFFADPTLASIWRNRVKRELIWPITTCFAVIRMSFAARRSAVEGLVLGDQVAILIVLISCVAYCTNGCLLLVGRCRRRPEGWTLGVALRFGSTGLLPCSWH